VTKAGLFGPLLDILRNAISGDNPAITVVVLLLFWSRPSAIVGIVTAVVVFAIESGA